MEESILKKISQINRATYQGKISKDRAWQDTRQEHGATILGYESVTGNYRVQNASGQIFSARAISSSCALCKGAQVSLVTPAGGVPIIDAMPRG